ncbi:NAD(P)/FAD-dependent oxidoreductase [Paenibacillus wynnii]|uniref:NAD(P)/FAD-dependent oxidoreductase n=1 Tax=Paenibacillus wynnii TaxID=268407 RepID=UPI002791C615|nr:FAD-dependent oxidoreductase [Paenibacillus wynnii]MDQ0191937.1 glycine/D-amino acid oxidase-like deaminating enzyme [Paenibacillus wynnii]
MNLISGQLPWNHTLPNPPAYKSLQEDAYCDCLVVGGGMGGAAASYQLSLNGADTILIEKRAVGSGSTHANTGVLQISNDKSLTSCMNTFGEKQGVLFYNLCRKALQGINKLKDQLDIDPYIIPRSSLLFASSPEDVPALREEYVNLKTHGFDTEFWEESNITSVYSFSKSAALYSRGDAEANPFRLVHSLINKAFSRGVRVYENTEAMSYEFKDDGVICHTRVGRIFAKKIIFAMGYETQEMKKDRGALLINTYAVMTRPLKEFPKWHERSFIWETARPYLYFRTTHDGRIIAGGKDEELTDPKEREVRVRTQGQKLLTEIEKLFPESKGVELEYSWGAVFGTTHDGLPYIGAHPKFPHCYFIEGYGGNGTVYSMIAAELLTDTLAGKHRPELDLFSLVRSAKPCP